MATSHRILVVGAGSIGERHIRCFGATERAAVSFIEPNPERRAEVAARYPNVSGYASIDAASEHSFTAAVIATPAPMHIPQAAGFVERSMHVLIEKPLSTTLNGVPELVDLAGTRGVVAAVAYVMRAHPAFAAMREKVVAGKFGKPLQLVAVAGQDFAFYRPGYRGTYYADRASGGGAVQDALTHLLNAAQWLIGSVDRVVADAGHLAIPGVTVEDTAHVIARHGDVLASYALNQFQAANETTITLACERGTVRFELHGGRWRSCVEPGGPWIDHDGEAVERDTWFRIQAHSFLDAIEGKTQPLCTLVEGLETLKATLAILRSSHDRAWVSAST